MPKHALTGSDRQDLTQRLASVQYIVRELSRQTDPWQMLTTYAEEVRRFLRVHRTIGISRRDLKRPYYRLVRSTARKNQPDPWKRPESLPLLNGGLLAELIYAGIPRVLRRIRLREGDPGAPYLAGEQSLMALPQYQQGRPLDMVILLRKEPCAFKPSELPELVWLSNLISRATENLVLARQLREAHALLEKEMKAVADVQRSLLPKQLPRIPGLELTAHYETASRAGGDYYDFFPLAGGRWGILIADASGHGAPAAVLMAMTHAIAHTVPHPSSSPSRMLHFINRHFCFEHVADSEAFVTAFFCVFDPRKRLLVYSCAGHPPPRILRSDGSVVSLDKADSLPLGFMPDEAYRDSVQPLLPGDRILFYTDGLTEAISPDGELFGVERLDAVLQRSRADASGLMARLLRGLSRFAGDRPATDDRTLLVADVQ
jgi:sigma-B regulation protein RsbU (phosphoserine phosphatase)